MYSKNRGAGLYFWWRSSTPHPLQERFRLRRTSASTLDSVEWPDNVYGGGASCRIAAWQHAPRYRPAPRYLPGRWRARTGNWKVWRTAHRATISVPAAGASSASIVTPRFAAACNHARAFMPARSRVVPEPPIAHVVIWSITGRTLRWCAWSRRGSTMEHKPAMSYRASTASSPAAVATTKSGFRPRNAPKSK